MKGKSARYIPGAKVLISAILAITLLEFTAMWKGLDGVALASAVGGITFLAGGGTGYTFGRARHIKEHPQDK